MITNSLGFVERTFEGTAILTGLPVLAVGDRLLTSLGATKTSFFAYHQLFPFPDPLEIAGGGAWLALIQSLHAILCHDCNNFPLRVNLPFAK